MKRTREDFYSMLKNRGIPPSLSKRITDNFFNLISETLLSEGIVRLKNFAAFSVVKKRAIKMMNNKTKKVMFVPERKVVRAKFSKRMHILLNRSSDMDRE